MALPQTACGLIRKSLLPSFLSFPFGEAWRFYRRRVALPSVSRVLYRWKGDGLGLALEGCCGAGTVVFSSSPSFFRVHVTNPISIGTQLAIQAPSPTKQIQAGLPRRRRFTPTGAGPSTILS